MPSHRNSVSRQAKVSPPHAMITWSMKHDTQPLDNNKKSYTYNCLMAPSGHLSTHTLPSDEWGKTLWAHRLQVNGNGQPSEHESLSHSFTCFQFKLDHDDRVETGERCLQLVPRVLSTAHQMQYRSTPY